jgi:hypothetical protein
VGSAADAVRMPTRHSAAATTMEIPEVDIGFMARLRSEIDQAPLFLAHDLVGNRITR